jgi:hypothetical protein
LSEHESSRGEEDRTLDSDDDEGTFEERLAAEEDLEDARGGERGLEETLEKLGFGELGDAGRDMRVSADN